MRDFDEDHRYCSACREYVRYLLSLKASYCTECGGPVKLFSDADHKRFQASLKPYRGSSWRPDPDDIGLYA